VRCSCASQYKGQTFFLEMVKVQHREPTPMIESSGSEEEADEDEAADEESL